MLQLRRLQVQIPGCPSGMSKQPWGKYWTLDYSQTGSWTMSVNRHYTTSFKTKDQTERAEDGLKQCSDVSVPSIQGTCWSWRNLMLSETHIFIVEDFPLCSSWPLTVWTVLQQRCWMQIRGYDSCRETKLSWNFSGVSLNNITRWIRQQDPSCWRDDELIIETKWQLRWEVRQKLINPEGKCHISLPKKIITVTWSGCKQSHSGW